MSLSPKRAVLKEMKGKGSLLQADKTEGHRISSLLHETDLPQIRYTGTVTSMSPSRYHHQP